MLRTPPARYRRWVLAIGATLIAAACGGDAVAPVTPAPTPTTPTPAPGTLTLALSAASTSITQGQSGTFTATITRGGSFAGAVELVVEGAPSGVTASVAGSPVAVGSTTGTITLQVAAAATPGASTLTVRARGTGVSDATAALALTVVAAPPSPTGAIALSANSATLSVTQGSVATATVSLTRSGGFAGPVELSYTGVPSGVTVSANPSALASGVTTTTVTVTAGASAAVGTSQITVLGKGTGVADASLTFTLTVAAAPPSGGFSIAVTPATASVVQGQSATYTVTVTRTGGFTGAVALTSAVPSGLTASFNPASVTGTTSTLTITAAANATVGTASIGIGATATGAANASASASVALSVTASPPPGGNGAIVWSYCGTDRPVFFAVQDGTGSWTRVTPGTDNVFRFDLTNARGGVATVQAVGSSHTLNVYYLTRDEMITYGTTFCDEPSGRTVSGTIAGASATDMVNVALGGKAATIVPSQGTTWSLANVRSGARDLVAARSALSLNGLSVSYAVSQMIIRRNISVGTTTTVPALDFASAEAFTPSSATVTIANGGGELTTLISMFSTANGASALLAPDVAATAATSRSWRGVPSTRLAAGDYHTLIVSSTASATNSLVGRQATLYTTNVADRTLTLGPALGSVTTNAVSGGTVRLRSQYTPQAQYNRLYFAQYQQTANGRIHQVTTSGGYLNGAGYDITVPDLSAISGWQAAYGLTTGSAVTWTLAANGWTGGTTLSNIGDGNVVQSATSGGQIVP